MASLGMDSRRRRLPSAPLSLEYDDNVTGRGALQHNTDRTRTQSEIINSGTSKFHKPRPASLLTQEILNQIIAAEKLPIEHAVSSSYDNTQGRKRSVGKQRVELVQESFKRVSGIKEGSERDPHYITRTVEIDKSAGQSLGFFVREGNGHDRKEGIFVSRVTVGCYVNVNGLLRAGDEITNINGVDLGGFGLSDVVAMIQIPKRLILAIRARAVMPTRRGSMTSSYNDADLALILKGRRIDREESTRTRSLSVMNVQSFNAMRANSMLSGAAPTSVTITPPESVKVIYDETDAAVTQARPAQPYPEVSKIIVTQPADDDWDDDGSTSGSSDHKQEPNKVTRRRLLPTPPLTPCTTPPKRKSDAEVSLGALSDTLKEKMLLSGLEKTQKAPRKLPLPPNLNNEKDAGGDALNAGVKASGESAGQPAVNDMKQEATLKRYESQYIKNMLLQQQQKHSMLMHSYSSGQLLNQAQQSEDTRAANTKKNFAADWMSQLQNKFTSDPGKRARGTSCSSCETSSQTSENSNTPSDPELVSQVDLTDLNLNVREKTLPSHAVSGMVSLTVLRGSEFDLPVKKIMEKKRKMYCAIDVDNQRKACTANKRGNKSFAWDEQFEIELQHSRQLNIQCLLVGGDSDKMMAKGTVTFSHLLKIGTVHEIPISLDPKGVLTVRIEFTEMKKLLERTPSDSKRGVFGFNLEVTSRVERYPVPLIVRKCITEIDKRGLDILGIYRICGNARRKKELRAEFDWDSNLVDVSEEKYPDINVITGVLKDYLRQLPEPLIAHEAYELLIKAMENKSIIETASSKRTFIGDFLDVLPNSNRETTAFLLDHLKNVLNNCEVNKMNAQNLAVCLGPVLLCPAPTSNNVNVLLDFKTQIRAIQFLLEIWPCKEDREQDITLKTLDETVIDEQKVDEGVPEDDPATEDSLGETGESMSTDDLYNSSDDDYV